MRIPLGVVASGHEETAAAAARTLSTGGNAFDAALSALCTSCIAEPVLASLGGGGFLLAKAAAQDAIVYDFFTHTPCQKLRREEVDFSPIVADFGEAKQEFHIGMGSIATPGAIKGLFQIQRELGRLPLKEITAPACELARQGVRVNHFQHFIATIVEPILRANRASLALHQADPGSDHLAVEGERIAHPEFADCLESLVAEGEALFYQGELGQKLIHDCVQGGGHLLPQDLTRYRVIKRPPLTANYRDVRLATNPPPSLGGMLIVFALALLEEIPLPRLVWGSSHHLAALATAMRLTQTMRHQSAIHLELDSGIEALSLDAELLAQYRAIMRREAVFTRGTTQISIVDRAGNLASMTLSNGEGAGYVLPGTGIMLNNMLGEEDINPHGFHQWPTDRRIASMMSPSLLELPDGSQFALGSGGSNRIRSAILQVLCNLSDFGMALKPAVEAPRIHYEADLLDIEPPCSESSIAYLKKLFPQIKLWDRTNLFFGGAHSVVRSSDGTLSGAGDPRRGGALRVVF